MPRPRPVPALLRGVDRAAFAVAFAVRLRERRIAVDFSGIETFTRALAVARPGTLAELYWVARISLVRRERDLADFDQVFAAVFDDVVLRLDPNARRGPAPRTEDSWAPLPSADAEGLDEEEGGGLPWATLPAPITAEESIAEVEIGVPQRLPSQLEGLADTPFDQLDPAELALILAWFETALKIWPTRRTRRVKPHSTGRTIALRPTLARARQTGWEPVELVRTRPVRKRRRVVMLCDVSQSMQPYATAYLHLMRAAAVGAEAEVFAFATSLTRLTAVLNHHSDAEAIETAGALVTDRFGGTRIAGNVRALLRSRHGGATRGAIVLIASDGWDSDEPAELAAGMARLRRRAHRVIWMNPRAAAPGYAPLVGAMAAALPYCDELLPAHTLRAMNDVLTAVTR
jgi:uncharacterized protein with von Willebrand factor type A (vWA) domain